MEFDSLGRFYYLLKTIRRFWSVASTGLKLLCILRVWGQIQNYSSTNFETSLTPHIIEKVCLNSSASNKCTDHSFLEDLWLVPHQVVKAYYTIWEEYFNCLLQNSRVLFFYWIYHDNKAFLLFVSVPLKLVLLILTKS